MKIRIIKKQNGLSFSFAVPFLGLALIQTSGPAMAEGSKHLSSVPVSDVHSYYTQTGTDPSFASIKESIAHKKIPA